MSDVKQNVKLKVYNQAGEDVGYFLNPTVSSFPDGDYEISGEFYAPGGELIKKLEFNPQSLPYNADASAVSNISHKRLYGVYVQRGRQPVKMTANATERAL